MDGDKSDNEENSASGSSGESDNTKRFKTTDRQEDAAEAGTSSTETEAVCFGPSPNIRNRNYRQNSSQGQDDSDSTSTTNNDVVDTNREEPFVPPPRITLSDLPTREPEDREEWMQLDPDLLPHMQPPAHDLRSSSSSSSSNSHSDSHLFSDSSDSSNSTVMPDTDSDGDGEMDDDHPLFKKERPKHNWFAVDELNRRQLGCSSKLQGRELFQRRCYGSLHCVRKLELMYKLEEHSGCVNSLNFHPDGSLLVSGGDDLKVVIWDWKLGKCLMKYKTKHKSNVFQSKFLHLSGDLHVATAAKDGQVRLAQLGKEEGVKNLRMLGAHKGPCHKLIVMPDQPHLILSAGEDGAVLSHDVREPKCAKVVTVKEDGKEVALYSIHGHPLKTHEFVVSGRDPVVRAYDRRCGSKHPLATYSPFKKSASSNGNTSRTSNRRNYHVTCAIYNYNGSEILASYNDADIYLFDANDHENGNFLHQYQGHRNAATIKGVNFFGPKSEFVVSGSDCGHLYFWERNTEALVQWLLADDQGVVNCLEPHPQLPFICTSGLDWDVKVWVPSSENEPAMEGLLKTVKRNKSKMNLGEDGDINESEMLWMLWRHLRNSNQYRAPHLRDLVGPLEFEGDSDASDSDNFSNEDSDGSYQNCATS